MLRRRVIEVLFWSALFLFLVPLGIYKYSSIKLNENIMTDLGERTWFVFKHGTPQPILKIDDLPRNLQRELPKTSRYFLETKISSDSILQLREPVLILGRIADSDRALLNGCELGRTGLTKNLERRGWWWAVLRVYPISDFCLSKIEPNTEIQLKVEIYKAHGPQSGIFGGPIGIGEYGDVSFFSDLIEQTRFSSLILFGILLLGIAMYYFWVFLLVPSRKYNGAFAVCAFFLSIYLFNTSGWLFRRMDTFAIPLSISFISASMTVVFLTLFLNKRFGSWSLRRVQVFAILSIGLWFFGFVSKNHSHLELSYQIWFSIFLIYLTWSFLSFIHFWWNGKRRDNWRYALGYVLVVISAYHDVIVSVLDASTPYLIPYGFGMFFTAVALSLAKEYADAFLHVEEQVDVRTQDLAHANEQLREMDRMKQRIFANISHDLKTPITVALGSVDTAMTTAGEALRPAKRSLQKLLGMIQELLDSVKADAGELKLIWKSTNLVSALKDWTEPFRSLCKTKEIELILDTVGFEGLKVPLDPSKFERIVGNLLSNALKFTEKGKIKVSIRTDNARVYIEVSDSGVGIPESEREKVFDRFFQSSQTSLKAHGGSGIGLSFVHEMMKLHNGDVWVEESEWGGSKFVLALPLSQNVEVTGEYDLREIEGEGARAGDFQGSLDVAFPSSSPVSINEDMANVLVVEDNPEVAQIIVHALKDEYNVFFSPNGKKAFDRMMGNETFDLVVSDLAMPEMTGDELVTEMRNVGKLSDVPVVVLTSHSEEERVVDLLHRGATDYVTKPFNADILRARVHAHLLGYEIARRKTAISKLSELGHLAAGIAHEGTDRSRLKQDRVDYFEIKQALTEIQ